MSSTLTPLPLDTDTARYVVITTHIQGRVHPLKRADRKLRGWATRADAQAYKAELQARYPQATFLIAVNPLTEKE
jgi:hypothetical protein